MGKTLGPGPVPNPARFLWVEQLKAVALLWIVLNHLVERLLDAPLIANPSISWPPFQQRLSQLLTPLSGYGWYDFPLNFVRYLGWFGDQGVQLFLIASGFGLTWGLLARQGSTPIRSLQGFWLRRAERIYPLWWVFHILFLITFFLDDWGMSPGDPAFWLSFVGLRITRGTLYYFSPAWWYIGLLIQLYLIFPLLWERLRRHGPLWLLLATLGVSVPIRAIGLLFFHSYLDAWSRGAVFITRLPEFVLGICLAAWFHAKPEAVDQWLRRRSTVILAVLVYFVGTYLSLSLIGMSLAPFLLGAADFVLLYAALGILKNGLARVNGALDWLGRHSYSLYLLHHPMILFFLAAHPPHLRFLTTVAKIIIVLFVTLVGAVVLERVVDGAQANLARSYQRSGVLGPVVRIAGMFLLAAAFAIGGEFAVRQFAPQEVNGWGERPALEPDPNFAFRLKPSRETRLRWVSYDYRVTANSLGFPGPEYPVEKSPGVFRILTIGDAFTSAEGLDTGLSWPRQLETQLAQQQPARKVQVLNFGITGYGPNQYAAVIEHFGSIYHPDLIIIGFFVNDFQDVLRTDESFRKSIGFDQPSGESLSSILHFVHLKRFIQLKLVRPLMERIYRQPSSEGYYLGNFTALEVAAPLYPKATPLVAKRLSQIKSVAESVHAHVLIEMIPASIQVCSPAQLAYYPRYIDLNDKSKFDLDLPQRVTHELADKVGFEYHDLRPVLEAVSGGCPYQRYNMHFTEQGHRVVAEYIARWVVQALPQSLPPVGSLSSSRNK